VTVEIREGDIVSRKKTPVKRTAVVLSVEQASGKDAEHIVTVEMIDKSGLQYWDSSVVRIDMYVENIDTDAPEVGVFKNWSPNTKPPACTHAERTSAFDCPACDDEYDVLDAADQFLAGSPTEKGVTKTKWSPVYKAKLCKHLYDPFDLGDGTKVYATAKRDIGFKVDPRETDQIDCAVYLDTQWIKSNLLWTNGRMPKDYRLGPEFLFVDWPDMGVVPLEILDQAVRWANHRMDQGLRLGTGCIGAHGRTGSFLAALLIQRGASASEAIEKVRKDHCKHAIETTSQEEMVSKYETYLATA